MQNTFTKRPHVGYNIQKIRQFRNKSQTDLAVELEAKRKKNINQQFISELEAKESIDDTELLQQVADILNVTPDSLRNLDWDAAISVISNTFTNHDYSHQQFASYIHNQQTYNSPLDKLIDLFEKEKAELKAEIERLKNTGGK